MLLLAGLVLMTAGMAAAGPPAQPNIILVMLDDAGFADFGANGSGFIQTPFVDAFAAEGINFTSYYANAPICAPTRTGIMTGRYPVRLGMRTNAASRIEVATETLPRLLQDAGYLTAHVGKWHLSSVSDDYYPLVAGFDYGVRFKSHLASTQSYFDPIITINNTQTVVHTGEHLTEVLTDYAIGFLNDNAGVAPLFLQFWHWAPHRPLEPPLDWAALYPDTEAGKVGAMISDVDEQLGRLFDTLDTLGIADDTLVIITSDNGGDQVTHGSDPADGPSNAPFRGGKSSFFEGGLRVPFFARWPNGPIPAGASNDSVAAGMDLIATFAELAGADVSALDLQGTSLVNALLGAPVARPGSLFWELKTIGRYFVDPDDILDDFAVREGDWKLVREDGEIRLYDLASDPGETTNLRDSNPVLADDLLAQHHAWRLDEGLIDYQIDLTQQDVTIDGDEWTFNGGRVQIAPHDYMNVLDKDFSFLVRLTPTGAPASGWAQIAGKHRSWRLALLSSQRVLLQVIGHDDTPTVLLSQPLVIGQTYDLAFTIFSWNADESTIRLYLDGVLQQETNDIFSVKDSSAPLDVGNTRRMTQPFIGVMDYLDLYSAALRPTELDDLFAALP